VKIKAANDAVVGYSSFEMSWWQKVLWRLTLWFERRLFAGIPAITTRELAAWLADPARPRPALLDVRGEIEFEAGHLPGARRANPRSSGEDALSLGPPGHPVVVYCSAGFRSGALARRMRTAGTVEVYNLAGSIFAWANEGRPMEARGGPVSTVHPCNRLGAILLGDGIAAKPDPGIV
jgi:rhodanese-related sulfurtransferase